MLFVDVRESRRRPYTEEVLEEPDRVPGAEKPSVGAAGSLVILQSFCRIPGFRLLYSQVRLFPDWLVLSGWGFTGRYYRRIALADIDQVEWFEQVWGNSTLLVHIADDTRVRVRLRRAGLWKYAIEERLTSREKTVAATLARRRGRYTHQAVYCA